MSYEQFIAQHPELEELSEKGKVEAYELYLEGIDSLVEE